MPLTVAMPPALQEWVDARLAQGRYSDAGDYLRDLVRRDRESAEDGRDWLRALVTEGYASGVIDAEPEQVIEDIIAAHPAQGG